MNRHFVKLIWKISLITFWLVFIIGLGPSLFWAIFANNNDDTKNIFKTNENTFLNTSNPVLWKTWVALTVNVGTRYTQRNDTPVNLYTDAITITDLMQKEKIWDSVIIWNNMLIIWEYKNVLKTDFKWTIDTSIDREKTLEAIIAQLHYRHNLAVDQMKLLIQQRTSFDAEMKRKETEINTIKTKIQQDFTVNDIDATNEDIAIYIELQQELVYARTYIVFINQFLNDYAVLNEYTKNLLDVLSINREAIIKDAYVVIPDWGVELLRDFDLLYNKWQNKN